MKKTHILAVFFGAVLSSQAGVVYFDLSPAGSDVAVGLSPSNEVPAVTNSTGSGGGISGGVVFDTQSLVLQVAIGYGSAAGFTDLTGVPTAMHIYGPAHPGENAAPLVDLSPYNFSAANPTNGGVIFGNLAFPSNSVSDLLAGLTYVSIDTASNPSGEIRGQLIIVPPVIISASANPDVLWPPNHKMVKVTVSATVTDASGPTTWKIISVSSNEPIDGSEKGKGKGNDHGSGNGDGNTSPDWQITGPHTLLLRAEREGNGDGRVYSITIQATDAAGNLSNPKVVTVLVPHDQGKH
jgi:hypothetical protein